MGMTNKYGLPASQTLGTLSGVTTAADAEERKKQRQVAFQTPGLQGAFPAPMNPAPTFARMQQNGEARPAPPGVAVAPAFTGALPNGTPFPGQAAPSMPALPQQVQAAMTVPDAASPVAHLSDDDILRQRRLLDVLGRALGLTSTGY